MKVRKGGIFTTIGEHEFATYKRLGFVKVADDIPQQEQPKPKEKVEKVQSEPVIEKIDVVEEPSQEVIEPDQPFQEEEPIVPKPKKKKKV